MTLRYGIIVVVPALLLAACSSSTSASKSNFSKAIDAALAKRCVTVDPGGMLMSGHSYPISEQLDQPGIMQSAADAKTANAKKFARLDALVQAGLLSEQDAKVKPFFGDALVPGRIYSLTEAGKKSLQDPNGTSFCAAHYQVDDVVDYTEPGNAMGVTISQVTYLFSPTDVAAWASMDAVKAAFSDLAGKLQPKQQARATVVLKNDGWSADLNL